MTDPTQAADGDQVPTDQVPTLSALIAARRRATGWSYRDLERESGGRLTSGRWQQLGAGRPSGGGQPPARFPLERDSIIAVAEVLGVSVTTVLLAAGASMDLDVRIDQPLMTQLFPRGTDLLTPRTQDAIVALVRAVVADRLERDQEAHRDDDEGRMVGFDLSDAPTATTGRDGPSSGRNRLRHTGDTRP